MTARPATRMWCWICRKPTPIKTSELAVASKQRQNGLDADMLICVMCGTSLGVAYVEEEKTDV